MVLWQSLPAVSLLQFAPRPSHVPVAAQTPDRRPWRVEHPDEQCRLRERVQSSGLRETGAETSMIRPVTTP